MNLDNIKKGATMALVPAIYLGIAFNRTTVPQAISYGKLLLLLPCVYGCVFAILKHFTSNMIMLGAIAGLLFSLIGRFVLNFPRQLFQMNNPNLVHPAAMMLYASLYSIFF